MTKAPSELVSSGQLFDCSTILHHVLLSNWIGRSITLQPGSAPTVRTVPAYINPKEALTPSPWHAANMPVEIKLYIFSLLDANDLLACSGVCREWVMLTAQERDKKFQEKIGKASRQELETIPTDRVSRLKLNTDLQKRWVTILDTTSRKELEEFALDKAIKLQLSSTLVRCWIARREEEFAVCPPSFDQLISITPPLKWMNSSSFTPEQKLFIRTQLNKLIFKTILDDDNFFCIASRRVTIYASNEHSPKLTSEFCRFLCEQIHHYNQTTIVEEKITGLEIHSESLKDDSVILIAKHLPQLSDLRLTGRFTQKAIIPLISAIGTKIARNEESNVTLMAYDYPKRTQHLFKEKMDEFGIFGELNSQKASACILGY